MGHLRCLCPSRIIGDDPAAVNVPACALVPGVADLFWRFGSGVIVKFKFEFGDFGDTCVAGASVIFGVWY